MTPIEKARTLLADASPELRRAVGECIERSAYDSAMAASPYGDLDDTKTCEAWAMFSRELIEAGKL
jgi:hypothetical protein